MNNTLFSRPVKPGRIALHVLFWIIVFIFFVIIYSVKGGYAVAVHNNLFFVPVHVAYFYAVAYWLFPVYLFNTRYVQFGIYLLLIIFTSTILSRLIDIFFVEPYVMTHVPDLDWSYKDYARHTIWWKLTSGVNFINALKGVNLVVWSAVVIKMFKLWYERKQAALQAELTALKDQVHPHFLFNTLNNLYSLTLQQSPQAPQVVLGLSEMLRYMLYECNADQVSLQKELLMLRQFMDLEKLRYEDRLDVTMNIEGDADDKLIAPLLMLPLLENAFKHGTSETLGEAWININILITDTELKFKISNSKPHGNASVSNRYAGHIGLHNLRKRLELLYPATHKLKIMDDDDTFLAILELKLKPQTITKSQPLPA